MMVYDKSNNYHVFREVVDEIFAQKDRQKSLAVIDKYGTATQHPSLWTHIIGTRLKIGKKAISAEAKFDELFEVS
jgi:hypothetical protein